MANHIETRRLVETSLDRVAAMGRGAKLSRLRTVRRIVVLVSAADVWHSFRRAAAVAADSPMSHQSATDHGSTSKGFNQGKRLHGFRIPVSLSHHRERDYLSKGRSMPRLARSSQGQKICETQLEQPLRFRQPWRFVHQGRSHHRLDRSHWVRLPRGLRTDGHPALA